MSNNYIIFGGTSLISYEIIRLLELKEKNNTYFVFCRNKTKFFSALEKKFIVLDKNRLKVFEADLLEIEKNFNYLDEILTNNKINGLFFLVGDSSETIADINNKKKLQLTYDINLLSPVKIINYISSRIVSEGFIVVITSVAGIRGRKIRIHYCSAKAGLINYLSGLRQHLYQKKIKVIDIRAGYISTEKFNQKTFNFLISSPKEISHLIFNSIKNNKKTVYSKPLWLFISIILQLIPDFIFQKFKF